MKRILFAASEAVPFMKTGGLADVTGSLPRYFDKEAFDVRVILPKYACMDEKWTKQLQFLCHFYVNLGWRQQYAGILTAQYEGITFYFVDNKYYFAGSQPYHNIYEDVEKFAFFSKAVLEALPYLDFCPDVIHCHDWQTGLVPVYLRTVFSSDNYYAGIKTIFSIHNLKFQGRWILDEVMDITGLPPQVFTPDKLEFYGEANYLKGGCVYADMITTVSKSYAFEITTKEGGEGLNGLFHQRSADLYAVTNGIDYQVFDPKTDEAVWQKYGIDKAVAGKAANKAGLQREFGLCAEADTFLLGMVSRMTNQKGFDLILSILEKLLAESRLQFVVMGTGEDRYQNALRDIADRYPDKMRVVIGYSEETAHKIYAASDAFLMPSLFEPCGLSQMISMRYGTVPIVRETGGLRDTVVPYNEYEKTGTGFSFANFNADELLHTVWYAMQIYYDHRADWNQILQRDMEQDFSWESSAREYEVLYRQ